MIIDRITLREIRMPLVHFFETSFGRTTHRRILLVEVESQGATGWGEVTTGELPFYNEEWVDGSWLLLRDIIGPRMLGREIGAAADVAQELPPVRGHRMTAGGLEAAVWDLEARMLGVPLWAHIGGSRVDVACGVSIGFQDNVDQLLGLIEREVAAGYRRVKFKIKPGWDVDVTRRVRESYPVETQECVAAQTQAAAFLVGLGIGQFIGASLLTVGLLDRRRTWLRADLAGIQVDFDVSPWPGTTGFSARGTF
jgi:O-succinylbenzoate synthase